MTIEKAFAQLTESEEFKEVAKKNDSEGGKYRMYNSRFKKGVLKLGAMAEILAGHGYVISADKGTATKKKK